MYMKDELPISRIAKQLNRARQTIHNVVSYLRERHNALDYMQRYQANKQRCCRRSYVGRSSIKSHYYASAGDIETTLHQWCSRFPKHLFKSITFDCGKEFSNWRSISNRGSNNVAVTTRNK